DSFSPPPGSTATILPYSASRSCAEPVSDLQHPCSRPSDAAGGPPAQSPASGIASVQRIGFVDRGFVDVPVDATQRLPAERDDRDRQEHGSGAEEVGGAGADRFGHRTRDDRGHGTADEAHTRVG